MLMSPTSIHHEVIVCTYSDSQQKYFQLEDILKYCSSCAGKQAVYFFFFSFYTLGLSVSSALLVILLVPHRLWSVDLSLLHRWPYNSMWVPASPPHLQKKHKRTSDVNRKMIFIVPSSSPRVRKMMTQHQSLNRFSLRLVRHLLLLQPGAARKMLKTGQNVFVLILTLAKQAGAGSCRQDSYFVHFSSFCPWLLGILYFPFHSPASCLVFALCTC